MLFNTQASPTHHVSADTINKIGPVKTFKAAMPGSSMTSSPIFATRCATLGHVDARLSVCRQLRRPIVLHKLG